MRSSGASGGPGIRAATLALVVAMCAGALAVFAPIPGIALAVVLVGAVVLWRASCSGWEGPQRVELPRVAGTDGLWGRTWCGGRGAGKCGDIFCVWDVIWGR